MFVADHNSAVRRNFKSRAMPEKEIPPARLVDIYLKNKKSEHILNKCSLSKGKSFHPRGQTVLFSGI